jgi:hypothetical protein
MVFPDIGDEVFGPIGEENGTPHALLTVQQLIVNPEGYPFHPYVIGADGEGIAWMFVHRVEQINGTDV